MRYKYSNLIELFLEIADKYPARPAIKDCKESLTYWQLNQHAVSISEALFRKGLKPGDRIGCVTQKDTRSIISFWGILMAGGIPVLLDNEDGEEANYLKIKTVAPAALILERKEKFSSSDLSSMIVLEFDELLATTTAYASASPLATDSFPGTCYILLTSGTSGTPKAVQVSHKNVLHYTYAVYERIGYPEEVKAAHVSTFAADLGLTNLLVALISGGMLRILNKTESTDPELFNGIVNDDGISLLKITPSHLVSLISNQRTPYKTPIQNIIVGGEKFSWQAVKNIHSLNVCANLYNHYGPTETTIGATVFKIEPSSPHFDNTGSVPIGKPLGQGVCFLENAVDNVGELYISGPGVSQGYLRYSACNNDKFVAKEVAGKSVVCYRTGDMCKMLDDGNFEFLYRNDRQVKVKGHRIELGEIEVAISAHPFIENAIATVSALKDHHILEVYFKLVESKELGVDTLRNWLLAKLPAYKVPSAFYIYHDAPYNSNGKIDLNALKSRCKKQNGITQSEALTHKNDDWADLVENTWKKVLGKDTLMPYDNFFESGGDSLLAIQLMGRLQRCGYKLQITDLNNRPVFKDLVALRPLKIFGEEKINSVKQHINKLTYSQYIFLQQDKFNLNDYCQTILLETINKVNIREMALAINCVLESHSQLTTVFRRKETLFNIERNYHKNFVLGTTVLDKDISSASQIQDAGNNLLKEIAIENGKLFTAHLFIEPEGKDYLYLACHHLAVDVISWNIIIDELLDYYDQILRGEQPAVTAEDTLNQFFIELEKNKAEFLNNELPLDNELYMLPLPQKKNEVPDLVEVRSICIPEEISTSLQNLDDQKRTSSLSGFLLNAFASAVMTEFGLKDLSFDLEFHGRPQHRALPDLSRSVAWWATTMPVNLESSKLNTTYCTESIESTASIANGINLNHARFPQMAGGRPDIRFNYLGHFPEQFENSSICMKPSSLNPGQSRSRNAQQEYALFFTSRFLGRSLVIDIQYQLKRFSRSSMESILQTFILRLKECLVWENNVNHKMLLSSVQSNMPSVGLPLFKLDIDNINSFRFGNTVFLTGATGFLGIHLLRELVRDENTFIYCLVRDKSQLHAEDRLKRNIRFYFGDFPDEAFQRIEVMNGNLLRDSLGLDAKEYHKMADKVNIVLHAAADINLFKSYNELKQANINATKNIIDLVKTGAKKEIHYVSTLAVSGYKMGTPCRKFCEEDFDQGQQFVSDYERTKFESEKIVRAFLNAGNKGKIYRVGHISGDSTYGRFQQNISQNRIFQIIKGLILTRCFPVNYRENISFSYVDVVARGITNVCLGITGCNMQCMHIENAQYLSISLIANMLRKLGYEIEETDMDSFNTAVANFKGTQGDNKSVELMCNWVQRSINYPRNVKYIQKRSLDTIARSGLYFPKFDFKWFARMIDEGTKAGYFYSPLQNAYLEIENNKY